ncbi:DHH family phosphoesterase [Shewanella abyssi]|uniref:DHH family phosphoesterase n=1 Tax=Shewanella abyssi TaxID=311789 RepID=UPI00200E37E0|nr:DHH family phosphoesterase [Shewanella abyssi]MCL1049569.1 DHH family phosphoesterase [Shewanella abyssi]
MNYDIFNGDADGIIALLQLRLAEPREATLVTGIKRDISLMNQHTFSKDDKVTVLDISMEKNQQGLTQALDAGAEVQYFDHHRAGDIPTNLNLSATIDLDPNICTSLLVDKYLNGKYRLWAITAAFGDNMNAAAELLAKDEGLTPKQTALLQEFGILINYNGYGASVADLHFDPKALYLQLLAFDNPFDAISTDNSPYQKLKQAYASDMAKALAIKPFSDTPTATVYLLGSQAWCRRISGVYGNELANQNPSKAHGVLTENQDGTYLVSVRAPLTNKAGADEVCSQFATGGGRKAAAGINALQQFDKANFIDALNKFYNKCQNNEKA